MDWIKKKPVYGDMIRIDAGIVNHFGIYAADDEIIQFGSIPTADHVQKADEVCVRIADISEYDAFDILVGLPDDEEKKLMKLPDEIVAEARSRVGEKGFDYDSHNCEHFVYECAMGISINPVTSENSEILRSFEWYSKK